MYGKVNHEKADIKLGNCKISESHCKNHLGIGLVTTKKSELEYVNGRISSCRSILFAINRIGSKRISLLPVTAFKLYWDVCMLKLTYGFEVMDVHSTSLENVESFHYQAAKIVQAGRQHTSRKFS